MDYYKATLDSLYYLLDITGERYWADWIAKDLHLWEQEKSVNHHLHSFGGMGSLNDVVICVLNGHKISSWQEPWANVLLNELKGLSGMLARNISKDIYLNINEIREKSLQRGHGHIQGARCLTCGFSVLSERNIDSYIAPKIILDEILNGLENNQLNLGVFKCLSADLQIIKTERSRIKEAVNRSHISYKEYCEFMRPCDRCGSDDTAVYRWIETTRKNLFTTGETVFTASKQNLPLRRK